MKGISESHIITIELDQRLNSLLHIQNADIYVSWLANPGGKRYYIQSAFSMPTREKQIQEKASLLKKVLTPTLRHSLY